MQKRYSSNFCDFPRLRSWAAQGGPRLGLVSDFQKHQRNIKNVILPVFTIFQGSSDRRPPKAAHYRGLYWISREIGKSEMSCQNVENVAFSNLYVFFRFQWWAAQGGPESDPASDSQKNHRDRHFSKHRENVMFHICIWPLRPLMAL